MRKLISLMLMTVLVLGLLAACGGESPTATPATEANTDAPTSAPATEAPATATEEPMATEEPTAGGAMVELPEVDVLAVEGDIVTAGSSTVYPLSEAMADRFREEGYADNLTIDSIGSGGGFERFCVAAETDIANASRPINDEEVAQCQANGREPIEFRVGTDALAVVVSAQNDFLTELSLEDLAKVYSGEVKQWSEIDPTYPAEAIVLYSPGTDSGTFDYFVEAVLDEDETKILGANPTLNEDDNVLVRGVEGSPYAIGYFGFAYYQENASKLKALAIDGIEPNEASAEDNSYPLSRPLYIYSDAGIMAEKPQVADFINFYLSFVNEEILDVGYFPASDEALNAAKQAWLDAAQ